LIPDEVGKDPQTTAALQRRHVAYEHELVALGAQVMWLVLLIIFLCSSVTFSLNERQWICRW